MRKPLCAALLLASLAAVPAAPAATIQIGATAMPGTTNGGGCSNCQDFQVATDAASPSYGVPAGDGGVITAWSVLGAPIGSPPGTYSARLLIFRPNGSPNHFIYEGASSYASPAPPLDGQVHTYATSIVVAPGDVIGLDYTDVPASFGASPRAC